MCTLPTGRCATMRMVALTTPATRNWAASSHPIPCLATTARSVPTVMPAATEPVSPGAVVGACCIIFTISLCEYGRCSTRSISASMVRRLGDVHTAAPMASSKRRGMGHAWSLYSRPSSFGSSKIFSQFAIAWSGGRPSGSGSGSRPTWRGQLSNGLRQMAVYCRESSAWMA